MPRARSICQRRMNRQKRITDIFSGRSDVHPLTDGARQRAAVMPSRLMASSMERPDVFRMDSSHPSSND